MTVAQKASSGNKAPGYRRKWRRTAPEKRYPAAATLRDLGRRRPAQLFLLVTLVVSLCVHAVLVGFVPAMSPRQVERAERAEDTYLQKVMQKDRAKYAAADAAQRITVPPPPPDPEKFVSETFSEELSRDLTEITAGLLDVKLEKSLTDHVQATLADELAEASRKITTGKLSSDEIKQIHRDFKQRAIGAAREWREVHREEYQVQIAAKTVTEWYEERVASQIRNIVKSTLFTGRGALWPGVFGDQGTPPGFIVAQERQGLYVLRGRLSALKDGRFLPYHFGKKDAPEGLDQCKPAGGGWVQLAGWPDQMSPAQAGIFRRLLTDYAKGWEAAFDRFAHDYHPHRPEPTAATKAELAGLWKRLMEQAPAETAIADLKSQIADVKSEVSNVKSEISNPGQALAACQATLKELEAATGKVFVSSQQESAYQTINRAVRSQVLRGDFAQTAYGEVLDLLVTRLRPPIEQLAESQFREGLVLSEEGVHEAMKEFRVKAIVLLRRDMENTVSRPFFNQKLFVSWSNPYLNKVTNESGPPTPEQIAADDAALAKAVESLPEADRAFVRARAAAVEEEIRQAIARTIDAMLRQILDGEGRLQRDYYARADTVDYADPFQQKLEARDMAWKGRKQDLTDLTEEGVPDTSTPLIALASGAGTGQIALKPVVATMHPGFFSTAGRAQTALRASPPAAPPRGAEWGFVTQAEVEPAFGTPNFEAIPFLASFPSLDGDLGDWGSIRPLYLQHDNVQDAAYKTEPLLLYAAWNYQGFFFGYHVPLEPLKFSLPSQYSIDQDGVTLIKDPRLSAYNQFVEGGDFLVLMFDTLDARLPFRGDPHAQEFYILPKGSATDPDLPGAERVFASRRYGKEDGNWGWARRICKGELFPPQPRGAPDGVSPYRVTRQTDKGYTVEVFMPRTVFRTPVLCPGWYVGFDAYIGVGKQPSGSGARYQGKGWANRTSWPSSVGNDPSHWGDLLMLGTDALMSIQDAAVGWPVSTCVQAGRSYLVTIKDPDRNINLAGIDTVLVSAECMAAGPGRGGAGAKTSVGDVELLVLKETGKNTSIFQGYINTQPGFGSDVYGTVEVSPGSVVRFGYVDIGDSHGRRNVIHEWRLPVIAPTAVIAQATPAGHR